MKNIKISIIVPIYNVENYLEKCLNSLVKQTLKDIEIIAVNNNSTDNSEQIAKEYTKKYKNIVLLNESNQGLGSARNCGLKACSGEYVMFFDSDDYADLDMCEKLYNFAIKKNADIVCFALKYIYPDKESIMSYNSEKVVSREYILNTGSAASKMYKRSFLESINFEFERDLWSEDAAIIPSLCLYTDNIYYLKDCYYNYVQRKNSITNQTKFNYKIFDTFTSIKLLKKRFEENDKLDEYKDELEYIFITNILLNIPLKSFRYKESKPKLKEMNKYMKNNYPKWYKNKYFKELSFKQKLYCYLFYNNCLTTVKLLYNVKHLFIKKEG